MKVCWLGVKGRLSSGISDADVTITSDGLADLPEIVAPDYAIIVLDPDGVSGRPEAVRVTAHAASATSATVEREVEQSYGGSPARAHAANMNWYHAAIPKDFHGLVSAADEAERESYIVDDGTTVWQEDTSERWTYMDGATPYWTKNVSTHEDLPDLATSGHPASVIAFTPSGSIVATTVQAAVEAIDIGKVARSLYSAKGDVLSAVSANNPATVPVGADGQVLTADSSQSAGVKWAAQSGLVVNTVAAAGATETLDGDDYNIHDVTLDESVTFTFTTSAAVAQFTLILRQDGSGGNSVTWPGSVKWHSLTAPTILTTGSAVHVLEFLTVNSGTTWRGFLASSAAS